MVETDWLHIYFLYSSRDAALFSNGQHRLAQHSGSRWNGSVHVWRFIDCGTSGKNGPGPLLLNRRWTRLFGLYTRLLHRRRHEQDKWSRDLSDCRLEEAGQDDCGVCWRYFLHSCRAYIRVLRLQSSVPNPQEAVREEEQEAGDVQRAREDAEWKQRLYCVDDCRSQIGSGESFAA